MSRVDKNGRSKTPAPHVRLELSIFYSAAYRGLSPAGRALLFDMVAIFWGDQNGKAFFSIRDAARLLGVDKTTAHRAIQELEAHGLIQPEQIGHFAVKEKHASIWRLTFYAAGGKAPTADYRGFDAAPGSAAARRIRLALETSLGSIHSKLRSYISTASVREIRTEGEKVPLGRCSAVREFRTEAAENPQFVVDPSVREISTHTVSQGIAVERASLSACNRARRMAQDYLARNGGYGGQGRLAQRAGLHPSKLSRFLSNHSGRQTLSVPELERLNDVFLAGVASASATKAA
jgi:hypothetical protein